MGNFKVRLDLRKLKGYRCSMKSKDGNLVDVIAIPVQMNDIYVSVGEDGKDKGYYLDLNAWENKNPLKNEKTGETLTHGIKPNVRNYKELTEEQKSAIPFVGNLSVFHRVAEQAEQAEVVQTPGAATDDDLPF